jgi:hypothetical protein
MDIGHAILYQFQRRGVMVEEAKSGDLASELGWVIRDAFLSSKII